MINACLKFLVLAFSTHSFASHHSAQEMPHATTKKPLPNPQHLPKEVEKIIATKAKADERQKKTAIINTAFEQISEQRKRQAEIGTENASVLYGESPTIPTQPLDPEQQQQAKKFIEDVSKQFDSLDSQGKLTKNMMDKLEEMLKKKALDLPLLEIQEGLTLINRMLDKKIAFEKQATRAAELQKNINQHIDARKISPEDAAIMAKNIPQAYDYASDYYAEPERLELAKKQKSVLEDVIKILEQQENANLYMITKKELNQRLASLKTFLEAAPAEVDGKTKQLKLYKEFEAKLKRRSFNDQVDFLATLFQTWRDKDTQRFTQQELLDLRELLLSDYLRPFILSYPRGKALLALVEITLITKSDLEKVPFTSTPLKKLKALAFFKKLNPETLDTYMLALRLLADVPLPAEALTLSSNPTFLDDARKVIIKGYKESLKSLEFAEYFRIFVGTSIPSLKIDYKAGHKVINEYMAGQILKATEEILQAKDDTALIKKIVDKISIKNVSTYDLLIFAADNKTPTIVTTTAAISTPLALIGIASMVTVFILLVTGALAAQEEDRGPNTKEIATLFGIGTIGVGALFMAGVSTMLMPSGLHDFFDHIARDKHLRQRKMQIQSSRAREKFLKELSVNPDAMPSEKHLRELWRLHRSEEKVSSAAEKYNMSIAQELKNEIATLEDDVKLSTDIINHLTSAKTNEALLAAYKKVLQEQDPALKKDAPAPKNWDQIKDLVAEFSNMPDPLKFLKIQEDAIALTHAIKELVENPGKIHELAVEHKLIKKTDKLSDDEVDLISVLLGRRLQEQTRELRSQAEALRSAAKEVIRREKEVKKSQSLETSQPQTS